MNRRCWIVIIILLLLLAWVVVLWQTASTELADCEADLAVCPGDLADCQKNLSDCQAMVGAGSGITATGPSGPAGPDVVILPDASDPTQISIGISGGPVTSVSESTDVMTDTVTGEVYDLEAKVDYVTAGGATVTDWVWVNHVKASFANGKVLEAYRVQSGQPKGKLIWLLEGNFLTPKDYSPNVRSWRSDLTGPLAAALELAYVNPSTGVEESTTAVHELKIRTED